MHFDAHVDRIDALTRNARNTWFVLLGVLVFITITLMGVEDIDFYGVDRATKLPLVDVEVPTRMFFVAAPILAAAVYGYFHLYLIRLWDALGAPPAEHEGRKLGDAVTPWLVTDMALFLRPEARVARAMDVPAFLLNVGLAWVFGIAVLGWLWWESATGRDWSLTSAAGVSFLFCLFAGGSSLALMFLRVRCRRLEERSIFASAPAMAAILALLPLVLVLGWQRSNGSEDRLSEVDLIGVALIERPADWQQWEIALESFQRSWCNTQKRERCLIGFDNTKSLFEWLPTRKSKINGLSKISISDTNLGEFEKNLEESKLKNWIEGEYSPQDRQLALDKHLRTYHNGINLTGALIRNSFLPGANLIGVRLEKADMTESIIEAGSMAGAIMNGAVLERSQLQFADLRATQLQRAILNGADFRFANLNSSNLLSAQLVNTDLRYATLRRSTLTAADIYWAKLNHANIEGANMRGANLSFSNFTEADLSSSDLSSVFAPHAVFIGSNFDNSNLDGARFERNQMQHATLRRASLRNAYLAGVNLDDAELDYTEASRLKLANSQLNRTSFFYADFELPDFSGSSLKDSNLIGLLATHASFRGADLSNSILNFSLISGPRSVPADSFYLTNLSSTTNFGGAIRKIDLSDVAFDGRTDWRNVFLDGTVVGNSFLRISGRGSPCQWVNSVIESEADFHSLWRWWVESAAPLNQRPNRWPSALRRVKSASPELRAKYGIPEDCTWQTGPLKTFPGPHGP